MVASTTQGCLRSTEVMVCRALVCALWFVHDNVKCDLVERLLGSQFVFLNVSPGQFSIIRIGLGLVLANGNLVDLDLFAILICNEVVRLSIAQCLVVPGAKVQKRLLQRLGVFIVVHNRLAFIVEKCHVPFFRR